MKDSHLVNGEFFPHWCSSSVDFAPNQLCRKINLIDAFNKKFVFLYMSNPKNPHVVFIIYLLGRKLDAKKFMIEFELKDGLRKVKFTEICFSDAHDIKAIINEHRCFVVPKKSVESFAKNGKLTFRFVIKKTDGIEFGNPEQQQHSMNNVMDERNQTHRQQSVPRLQKAYQSESNLILTAQRYNEYNNNNGHANRKPKYRRTPKANTTNNQ